MNNSYRFGSKYSPYTMDQISGPINQKTDSRITTYDMVAKKLLDLCQDEDIREKMRRYFIRRWI